MATSEVSSEDKRTALIIKGLIQGRDAAKQLQVVLGNPVRKDGFAAADGYMEKILRSFSESIDRISDDSSDHPNGIWKKSRSSDSEGEDHRGGGSEGSNECKKRPHASSLTDKRVCYKRRRSSEARTKVSPTMEDGQAWRKYGQKIILNAKFPRSYFRCTHKYDQGCKATKQVQSMEDNPQLYHITYIDYHTCKGMLKGSKLIASETDVQQHLKIDNLKQRDNFSLDLCTSSQAAAVKEEHKEQDTKSDLTDNIDSFLQPDIMDFELSSVSQMFSLGTLDDVTSHDFDNLFLNDGDFS